MIEKIKHAYYMRRALKAKNIEKIIKRRNRKEISRLFDNLAEELKPEVFRKLISQCISEPRGDIYGLVSTALCRFASEEKALKLLISEAASETNGDLFDLVNNALCKVGSEDELIQRVTAFPKSFCCEKMAHRGHDVIMAWLKATPYLDFAYFDEKLLLQRGNYQEIKEFFMKFNGTVGEKLASWALASKDPDVQAKLFSKGLRFSESVAQMILASGNKQNILLLSQHHLSSAGIRAILSGNLPLTEDERKLLESRLPDLERKEKAWDELAYHFDCIR